MVTSSRSQTNCQTGRPRPHCAAEPHTGETLLLLVLGELVQLFLGGAQRGPEAFHFRRLLAQTVFVCVCVRASAIDIQEGEGGGDGR